MKFLGKIFVKIFDQNSDIKIQKNFATNTLGMYILTKTFLNESKISKNGRVVTVTSGWSLLCVSLKSLTGVCVSKEYKIYTPV